MGDWMTAAVLHGKEDLRLERVPRPKVQAGEIVLQVGAALTCGTDLKVYRRGYHARMLQPPIPFGHEVAGVVADVGAGVTAFRAGDRVVALNSAPCGVCFWCGKRQENLCEDLLFNNGAYAEYMRIPARIVQKNTLCVPESMKLEHAALTEPLACVVLGFEATRAAAGDRMVVIGAGPIGLMWMQVGAAFGVHVIAVVKRLEQKETAQAFGAAETVCLAEEEDPVLAVRKRTPGERGVDVAVEAVADPATWEQAVAMVRRGGVVNFFGGPPSGTEVRFDTNRLHYADLTLQATFHHTPATVRTAFDLLASGRLPAAQYITGHAELGEVPALYERMIARGAEAMVSAPEEAPVQAEGDGSRSGIKTAVLPAGVDL